MKAKISRFSKAVFVLALLKVIFTLSLFLAFILWSFPLVSLNSNLWMVFQERSGVVLNSTDVKNFNEHVIDFFFTNSSINFLNSNELSHMQDVRNVLIIVNGLAVTSFILVISNYAYLSKADRRFLIESVRKTSLIVFGVTLIFSIVLLTNFYQVFTYFHELVFVKNFAFPSSSLLKTLYPDRFFYEISAFYVISIMFVSLVVTVVTHRLKLK